MLEGDGGVRVERGVAEDDAGELFTVGPFCWKPKVGGLENGDLEATVEEDTVDEHHCEGGWVGREGLW